MVLDASVVQQLHEHTYKLTHTMPLLAYKCTGDAYGQNQGREWVVTRCD